MISDELASDGNVTRLFVLNHRMLAPRPAGIKLPSRYPPNT